MGDITNDHAPAYAPHAKSRAQIDIPPDMVEKWQHIVDLLATTLGVVDSLITRVHPQELEVFSASHNPENQFSAGMRVQLDTGYYCETVMAKQRMLQVTDARADPDWQDAPEIAHELFSYLGFPLRWPDGEIFGTICVHDQQANPYSDQVQALMRAFQAAVEADLRILIQLADLQRMEHDLRLSEARYRALVDHFPGGMVQLFDHDLRLVLVGGADQGALFPPDVHPDDAHPDDVQHEGDRPALTLTDMLPPGVASLIEPRYRATLDGATHRFEVDVAGQIYQVQTVPIATAEAASPLGMAVWQNVTGVKAGEAHTLQLALEQEKVRLITDFVGDVSHKFRSPLSSIKTATYMIHRLNEHVALEPYIERIQHNTTQINTLIEDFLLLTRLDSGPALNLRVYDLNALARDALNSRQDTAAAANLSLSADFAPDLPDVQADITYLHEALCRLLDNAIQYTPPSGTITVRTRQQDQRLTITVQDTGIGIEAEALPHIFKRFYRHHTADKAQGAGLGLSIVESIVKSHQGTIAVTSEPGQGAQFTIALPIMA